MHLSPEHLRSSKARAPSVSAIGLEQTRLKIHPKGMAITIPSALVFFGEKKDFQGCAGIDISNVFDQSC
jgi:hypothetical protein